MSAPIEGSLPEDLQRCRRLVAAMRGQVLAPSWKQQVLKQLVIVVSEKQIKRGTNASLSSPRQRYLRDIQAARVKIIQRRWRRNMLQKRILAKIRMLQKWKNRQGCSRVFYFGCTILIADLVLRSVHLVKLNSGISRFRTSALIIQRVFRGHFVRKHKIDVASYIAGLVPRVDHLRSDREAYHLKCEHVEQELQQIRLDIDVIRDKISQEEKAMALQASRSVIATDSNVAHEAAAESIAYYKAEVTDLEALARHLEQELREQEPVVHFAATLIQAAYRGFHCRIERKRERQRQRQIYIRMLQSKDLCYDRMYSACVLRNEKLWNESARIIAGLYHIQQAKMKCHHHRQHRAVRRISRVYLGVQTRTSAKQSLHWKKVKRQAKELAKRKLRALLQLIWSGWRNYVQKETQRHKLIDRREKEGLDKWRNAKAMWFLAAYRERVAKREQLEQESMQQLDARVLHHIRAAIQTSDKEPSIQAAQEISSRFLLLIRSDIWTWQVPDKQFVFLARRYTLPLDYLPMNEIILWLADEAPSFVDLYAPLPTQTLLILQHLSQYFALHSRVLHQTQHLREVYEAHMVAREYLTLLYTANVVRLSPSTTFSSHQRQRAVVILHEKDRVEYLPNEQENELLSNVKDLPVTRDAFTSFHCLWNRHLCERCLSIRPVVSRQCKCCGHHQFEVNTVAKDLRLESREVMSEKEMAQETNPTKVIWVSSTERCDFMVLNAFLHVLAPASHESRRTNSLDVLWKLAMKNAYEPVAELYNRLSSGSLNELLNASRGELEAWTKECCPPGVDTQLQLFIEVMKDEWNQVDTQMSLEAHAAATIFSQHQLRVFHNGEHSSAMTNNSVTVCSSMIKRKKSKRPKGCLKPLVSLNGTTQQTGTKT